MVPMRPSGMLLSTDSRTAAGADVLQHVSDNLADLGVFGLDGIGRHAGLEITSHGVPLSKGTRCAIAPAGWRVV